MRFTHIIWDFNGTVLDDALMSVHAVNDMLTSRGLPTTDLNTYRDTLCMPLTEYYKTVGIFSDDIATLSAEFRRCCAAHPEDAMIFDGVYKAVDVARSLGIRNVLLSSLYHKHLVAEAKKYGVEKIFDHILGLPDRMLGSKYDNARKFFENQGIDPTKTLFLGDLISDAQMAQKLGADCILISNGHMSHDRCKQYCDKVFYDIESVIKYIKES